MKHVKRSYSKVSFIPTTIDAMLAFHEAPQAMNQLTMPPIFLQVIRDERVSLTEGELEFRLWFGPVPVRWVARHEPGPIPTAFTDRMIDGPMKSWVHEHIFEAEGDFVRLEDRITFVHKPGWRGWLSRLFFDGIPLNILFTYRHWKTKISLVKHNR